MLCTPEVRGTMLELTDENVGDFLLCDAKLDGIRWSDAGDIRLSLITGSGKPATLTCSRAREAQVDLKYPQNHGGRALSWQCTFKRIPDGAWSMEFEFPPQGSIRLVCDSARLEFRAAD